jgi:hypothetical protein
MSAQEQSLTIKLPALHAGQRRVAQEARRFNVLACGRRFGKTTFGIDRNVHPALRGLPVVWFSPTYKMLAEVWRDAKRILAPVTRHVSTQEKRLELVTGGTLDMWSLDNPDAARGRKYSRAVIDEAAMISGLEEAWQAVIRPTLTDYEGDAWFLSTPRGVNFFKDLFDRGQDPERGPYASWQMPTLTNPHIPPGDIESAREELPEMVFRQEYLAEFMQGEGAVFRNVEANMVAPAGQSYGQHHDGHRVVAGVDWAQKHDFTAISVVCATCRKEVALDRFNKIEWEFQRGRLKALAGAWKVRHIEAEENSIGSPNIEALRREGLNVVAFTTTAQSKPPLIQSLALALERREYDWLNLPVATAELVAYESKVSANTGRISYGAPEGKHDDTVIARALALKAATAPEFKARPLRI